jgi:hypothetical protein
MHKSGNIIVTADYTGTIKIFRQDCAWARRKGEEWDRSSMFSKRPGTSSRAGSIAGTSIATKASQRSLRDGRTSAASQVQPSDRILSWRQGIASTPNINANDSSPQSKATSRSISPHKSLDQTSSRAGSNLKHDQVSPTSTAPTSLEVSDTQHESTTTQTKDAQPNNPDDDDLKADLAHRRADGDGMVLDQVGRSDFFWDSARLAAPLARQRQLRAEDRANELQRRPSLAGSAISQLTAEREQVSDISDQEEVFGDAEEEGPEKKMTCRRCGGVGFEARRGMEGVRLVCGGCGLRVEVGR